MSAGALQPKGSDKPIMRGEAGLVFTDDDQITVIGSFLITLTST
jgi:hypothetical protein